MTLTAHNKARPAPTRHTIIFLRVLLLYTELPLRQFTPRPRNRRRRRERRSKPSRHTGWTQTSTGSPDSPRLQIPPDPHLFPAQSSPFDPAIPPHTHR